MNSFTEVAERLPRDQIHRMRDALATGKWPDGQVLTDAQRSTTMEAVVIWEARHLPPEERIGYMPPKPHRRKTPAGGNTHRIPTVSQDDD